MKKSRREAVLVYPYPDKKSVRAASDISGFNYRFPAKISRQNSLPRLWRHLSSLNQERLFPEI